MMQSAKSRYGDDGSVGLAWRQGAVPGGSLLGKGKMGSVVVIQVPTNDHKTDVRRVQYPWHSLYGRDVIVCGSKAGTKGVLRCQVDDDHKRDNREVPTWMFDQVVCARMYHSSQSQVSWQALVELRRLLDDSVRRDVREHVENKVL